jgi:WD40 repeat protein
MLRQRARHQETDRFISGRSIEREKSIDKYIINDKKEAVCKNQLLYSDEKENTKKVYLSLLKSQLFESNTSEKINEKDILSSNESRKQKKISSLNKSPNPTSFNTKNNSIVKKLGDNIENLTDYSFNKNLITLELNDILPVQRKISRTPYKVLDAPLLRDDFYLHLLDWSSLDTLAVGLDKTVYLWDAKNCAVKLLCTLKNNEQVCSVHWMRNGYQLLIGSSTGEIAIWDVNKSVEVQNYKEHTERVSVMNCINENLFSSGSQDFSILNFDFRKKKSFSKYSSHTQEVCGLKWSPDERLLASGGNDNKLIIWDIRKSNSLIKFSSHKSAVKAIDWSNHKFGLLASGGGTQDRTIKFWNTNLLKMVDSIETNSQVCNLMFSKNTHEFVTTHGYSDNLIVLWKYPELDVVTTLKGHKDRVIYLSSSPDFNKIVTGAGDETVRFWNIFEEKKEEIESKKKNQLFELNLR